MSVVREFLPSMEQFIDEGKVIGTVLYCNEKLGAYIRKTKETTLNVRNYEVDLPIDFQKVIYVAALELHSFGIAQYRDPFNNSIDFTDPTTVELVPYTEACMTKCNRIIKRKSDGCISQSFQTWTELSLSPRSYSRADSLCVNRKIRGKYSIDIDESKISTPFREGELYMMYHANLIGEDGQIQIPFDPLIFPYLKWSVIEEILLSMVFNSDQDVAQKLQLAKRERQLAWVDAWNYASEPTYNEAIKYQQKKEMQLYSKYFKGYY